MINLFTTLQSWFGFGRGSLDASADELRRDLQSLLPGCDWVSDLTPTEMAGLRHNLFVLCGQAYIKGKLEGEVK